APFSGETEKAQAPAGQAAYTTSTGRLSKGELRGPPQQATATAYAHKASGATSSDPIGFQGALPTYGLGAVGTENFGGVPRAHAEAAHGSTGISPAASVVDATNGSGAAQVAAGGNVGGSSSGSSTGSGGGLPGTGSAAVLAGLAGGIFG